MKKSPKPIRKAKVEPSFSHYLEGLKEGQPLELVLVGHLVLDALLVEIIQLKIVGDTPWNWHFPTKVQCCVDKGFLSGTSQPFYTRFNDIRNDFAHMLGHKLTFDDVFALVADMANAGYDFSDDTIHSDRKLSEEWYGIEGVLIEILNNLYFELAESLHSHGGADRMGG